MKLTKLLLEYPGAFTPRPKDEWEKNKQDREKRRDPNLILQKYIENGSVGCLDLIGIDQYGVPQNAYLELKSLPDNLTVDGFLEISEAINLTQLPRNLVVKGNLWMSGCGVKELPADLKVLRDLWADYCFQLNHIDDNFSVIGDFKLRHSSLPKLPNGLAARNLDISYTLIDDIPFNLKVKVFTIEDTPLAKKYTGQEILKVIEEKGGYVEELII